MTKLKIALKRCEFLRAITAVMMLAVVALTLVPWFGMKVSRPNNSVGVVVLVEREIPSVTVWQVSVALASGIVLLSLYAAAAAAIWRRERLRKVHGYTIGFASTIVVAMILFLAWHLAPHPFPAQTAAAGGQAISAEFGMLMTGKIALLLAAVSSLTGFLLGRRLPASTPTGE